MSAATKIESVRAMRRAAVVAAHASSLRNTQPWRIVIRAKEIEVHTDPTRRLVGLDPMARHLYLSCGCALFNARASLAADGVPVYVDRIPDPARPGLVARVALTPSGAGATRDEPAPDSHAVFWTRSVRDGFTSTAVPPELVKQAIDAATNSWVDAVPVPHNLAASVARLELDADAADRTRPSLRAELRSTADGGGRLRTVREPVFVVLATASDDTDAWIRAGEASQSMALQLAYDGFGSLALTRAIERPAARTELQSRLGVHGYPQLLVQIGRPRSCPPGRRRRLVNVLIEAE
jgi:hypothetical protein